MSPLLRRLLIVAVLMVPSLCYLWPNRDVPTFCDQHDDCIYFVSAKSLADGGGYRIESLPGEPPQTKYPPLYPALLALAWKINPQFPANLLPALWLSWLAIPVSFWLLASLYPRMGMAGWRTWALLAAMAINPYTMLFSTRLLSEPWFIALLVGSLLLAERASSEDNTKLAVGSGIMMGLAYLARSAGIVGLVTMPLFFLLRKQRSNAIAFAAALFPFIASWMLWAKLHQVPASDPSLMYYVDYAGFQLYNVHFKELPLLVWKNVDALVWSFGSLILPRVSGSVFLKMISEMLGVACIIGVVRLVRRGYGLAYALFALGSSGLLAIWHFPPNERFVFPMFPLLVAGMLTELEHLYGILKAGLNHPDPGQRRAGRVILALFASVFIGAVGLQIFMQLYYMPADARQARAKRDAQQPAFAWMREHLPPQTMVVALDDPLVYLYTGHHSIRRQVLPIYWYHEDSASVVRSFSNIPQFAREHGLQYFYYSGPNFGWGVEGEERDKIDASVRKNPELERIFENGETIVYRVQEGSGLAAAPNSAP